MAILSHAEAVREYVVSAIDFEGTEKEKINYFFDTFQEEFGFRIPISNTLKERRGSLQDVLREYLMGLPACINHAYTNFEIEKLLRQWKYLKEDDYTTKIDQQLDKYWNYIAMALIVVGRRNKIPLCVNSGFKIQ